MKFRLEILAWKKLAGIFGLKNVPKFHAERIGLKWHFGGQMYRALVSIRPQHFELFMVEREFVPTKSTSLNGFKGHVVVTMRYISPL